MYGSSDAAADIMTVPSVPESVAAVRRFAVERCMREGATAACDTVALLVSEIATNALVHGDGQVRVALHTDGSVVRVEISDESVKQPTLQRSAPLAEGGRGLALVEALSTSWGTDLHETGKTVWFEVPG
jgi:serine/threonine-protein kinase RsbW